MSTYPTELVARAKYEISVFERPSSETSVELLAEVEAWRRVFGHLGSTPDEIGNLIYEKSGEREKLIEELRQEVERLVDLNFELKARLDYIEQQLIDKDYPEEHDK